MKESDLIEFIQKGFQFAQKAEEQIGIIPNSQYEQANEWLDLKHTEAANKEIGIY